MVLLSTIIRLYEVILLVRVLMSWIRPDPHHPVVQWVYRLTEPVLEPVRRILPTGAIGLDLSPLVVLLLLDVLRHIVLGGVGYF